MSKSVSEALKAKAWTFEAKTRAKAIKFSMESPRGQALGVHHWYQAIFLLLLPGHSSVIIAPCICILFRVVAKKIALSDRYPKCVSKYSEKEHERDDGNPLGVDK